jgi:acyl carrier protein
MDDGGRRTEDGGRRTEDEGRKAIVEWLTDWLSRELRIASQAISRHHSFADYGLDSVTAVEMVMALGEWLHHPLEATIVWNFPTIDALAAYLANEVASANHRLTTAAGVAAVNETAGGGRAVGELDELSEMEIAELLAAELQFTHKAAHRGK